MSFDILVFKSRSNGVLRSLENNSGVTLATCEVCKVRKENCEKYSLEPFGSLRKKKNSVYNRLYVREYWFCSNECLNFYVLRYLI